MRVAAKRGVRLAIGLQTAAAPMHIALIFKPAPFLLLIVRKDVLAACVIADGSNRVFDAKRFVTNAAGDDAALPDHDFEHPSFA